MIIKDKLNTITMIARRLFYIITILVLIISVHNYNKNNPLLKLEKIIIEGAHYLSENDIRNLIIKDKNLSIFDYDIAEIKQSIEQKLFVKTVKIRIKDFNKLYIQIEERVPIALIVDNNKQEFIDIDDTSLPINIKSLNSFPVPVINIEENNLANNDKKIASSIIKYILSSYPEMYKNLSEIHVSPSLITITTDNNTKIYINPNMPLENIDKLRDFEKSIKNYKHIDDHQYINLIYDKQVVVKERKYL